MKHQLGIGWLTWPADERVSDRYGLVGLADEPWPDLSLGGVVKPRGAVNAPQEMLRALDGKRGRFVVEVLANAPCYHIGDLFRGISPSTPTIGERVILGDGALFVDPAPVHVWIGLRPDDGRKHDWLDPHKLYHVLDQKVILEFEEGDAR